MQSRIKGKRNRKAKVESIPLSELRLVGKNERGAWLPESRQLFDTANQPKEIWVVPNAKHEDLNKFAPEEYEQKALAFFDKTLRGEK
jgi:uncharacterized protein